MTPVLADDSEIPDDIEEILSEDVEMQPGVNSVTDASPAALVGKFCIKYALSERAMKALLEILRLKLDVSLVTSINKLLHASRAAPVFLHTACSTCHVLMRAPF